MKKNIYFIFSICFLLNFSVFSWGYEENSVTLSLPDIQWALNIKLSGFELEQKEISSSGDAAMFQAKNPETGIVISAYLEKAPQDGNSKDCRSYYWEKAKKSPFVKKKINKYELNDLALVEYMVPEFQKMEINQKNINAYLAFNNYWIDIHLSKIDFKDEDKESMSAILNDISIDSNYTPSAYDNYYYGNIFYQQNQYKKAIPFFEKALDQEKQLSTFGKDNFIILVDLLGMSYGISGDLTKTKEIYQWAITQEPEYPMFYYNLACAYTEGNEFEKAILNLDKAYQYKKNMLPGETFPDPSKDSSFSRLMSNSSFSADVEKIKNLHNN